MLFYCAHKLFGKKVRPYISPHVAERFSFFTLLDAVKFKKPFQKSLKMSFFVGFLSPKGGMKKPDPNQDRDRAA